jgi:hypothetical protein
VYDKIPFLSFPVFPPPVARRPSATPTSPHFPHFPHPPMKRSDWGGGEGAERSIKREFCRTPRLSSFSMEFTSRNCIWIGYYIQILGCI